MELPAMPARYRAKTNKKCKSCLACRNNPRLRDRYYKAWFDRTPGEETLENIGKELSISNQAIYRHAHNHMRRRVAKMTAVEQVQSKAEDFKAEAMKALEVSFDHQLVIPKEDYETAIDRIIADGMAQMGVNSKDVSINQIIAAAKLKGEWKLKKRGQDTEIIKMMYRGASGFSSPTKSPNLGSPGSN